MQNCGATRNRLQSIASLITVVGRSGKFWVRVQISHHTEGGLHPPLPVQTQLDKVTNCNKQLPQPSQAVLPFRSMYQLVNKSTVQPVKNQNSQGFCNRLFLLPKPNNRWRPVLDLSTLNTFFKLRVVQNGDPRGNKNLPTGRGVGHIHRLQDAYLHIPIPMEFHSGGPRGQTHGTSEGYKDSPIPRRLAGESLYPRHLSLSYTDLSNPWSRTRVAGE